jgi:hypothetical protein
MGKMSAAMQNDHGGTYCVDFSWVSGQHLGCSMPGVAQGQTEAVGASREIG